MFCFFVAAITITPPHMPDLYLSAHSVTDFELIIKDTVTHFAAEALWQTHTESSDASISHDGQNAANGH